jgi:hypothetical protein
MSVCAGAFCVVGTLKGIERALRPMSEKQQQQEKSSPETPEELVSLAQEYFSHDFPNSGGGCPTTLEIARQIEAGQLPDESLREHLFGCSKCFVVYRERLQKSREMQPVVTSLRRPITYLVRGPGVRILVPSLSALLVALLALFYFSSKNSPEKGTLVNSPGEVVNANANTVTSATHSPAQPLPSPQNERAAPQVARVDLTDYSLQRGNEPGEEPAPIQIERKSTAFTITLPDGSPPGTYSISILNAFGKSIKSRTSYSADGKRLTAILDLNNLRNQQYRLCVSRSDEPPNCYPIVISNRGK